MRVTRRALRWLPVLCIPLPAVPAPAAESEVPLTNPGFEQGTEGWHWWYQKEPVQVNVIPGDRGNCLQLLGEPGTRVAFYQTVNVEPQRWYRIGFRYNAGPNGAAGGSLGSLNTRVADQNGKHIDYPCSLSLPDTFGAWVQAEAHLLTPLSIGSLIVEFNSAGACDLRLDDVTLTQVPPPPDTRRPNTWDQLAAAREEPLWFSSWQYNLRADSFRRMAMKYGWRYRYLEQYDQYKTTRTLTWVDALPEAEAMYATLAEKELPACVYLHYPARRIWSEHYGGRPPAGIAYIIDPAFHDAYVEACREACTRYGQSPGIRFVFVEDEAFGQYLLALPPRSRRTSDHWAKLDADVRERFGGGVHGLPEGPDDPNPYRWIAYCSFAGDQLCRTFRRVAQVVAQSGCGAQVLGPDEAHFLYPLPWHELSRYVDIFTGQSLPARRGANAHNVGFLTKSYADMTGKPVHSATQIVMYGGSPSPREVQRRYSEVLQNGGEGQMLIAEEWGDRELSHHQYSAPERWATVKNLLELMGTHRVRTPTRSEVGILYSSPSAMAQGGAMDHTAVQAAYSMLGPTLRAWPRMIDSLALARGEASLEGLSTLILPQCRYERPETLRCLEQFVAAGGLLICCDPEGLSRDTIGNPLPSRRLLGARPRRIGTRRQMEMSWPISGRQRAYDANAYELRPWAPDTRTIATYPDGSAAVTMHGLGKGGVVLFGSNPLAADAVTEDAEWVGWWRSVLCERDVPMDLPIWDLRLPDSALVEAERPEDTCITGNAYVRCQNGVYLGCNDPAAQSDDRGYRLSVAPDLSTEAVYSDLIPFSAGNLTNRARATKGPFKSGGVAETPYREADWADRWSAGALSAGLSIEFRWPQAHSLSRLRLWYSGALPDLSVEGGVDGETWVPLARVPGADVGEDVEELSTALEGQFSRVRLVLAPGTDELALADVEVWAQSEE